MAIYRVHFWKHLPSRSITTSWYSRDGTTFTQEAITRRCFRVYKANSTIQNYQNESIFMKVLIISKNWKFYIFSYIFQRLANKTWNRLHENTKWIHFQSIMEYFQMYQKWLNLHDCTWRYQTRITNGVQVKKITLTWITFNNVHFWIKLQMNLFSLNCRI